MSYYLYTGGVLKLVVKPEPQAFTYRYLTGSQLEKEKQYRDDMDAWRNYVDMLPSIEVSEDLKRIWKKGQRVEEGKDFKLQFWTDVFWMSVDHLVNRTPKPGSKLRAIPAPLIEAERKVDQDETYLPPDSGDMCWTTGAKTFTRKEVWYILYTQRAMISNDLKSYCGKDMTEEMFEILENPRKPAY